MASKAAFAPASIRVSSRCGRRNAATVVRRVVTSRAASEAASDDAEGASAAAAAAKKVVVLGGSGFVGSRVVKRIADTGAKVTSVSRSGTEVQGAYETEKIDLRDEESFEELKEIMDGADAVVSCVGVIGGDDNRMLAGNGFTNVRGIKAAKAAGVKRFVYVSVASIVPDVVGATPLMKGYFAGKVLAEEALAENFDASQYLVVKPSFIYGGDEFSVNPPRVTQAYGDILVKLLGSELVKSVAEKTPGPIKLTLAEPVSVDDVAGACAAGAMVRRHR